MVNRHKRKSVDFSFPHIRIAAVITILTILSLAGAWILDFCNVTFWSSVLANIFAGLITGLVLCLISGSKQIFVAKLENQKLFLNELEKLINDFQKLYNELVKKPFSQYDDNDGLFEFIYNVGSHANWINDYILQSSFDETIALDPQEYCKHMGYDALALTNDFEELHSNLYNLDVEYPSKKEILKYFDKIGKQIRHLKMSVYNQKKEISAKLERINYTLL